MARKGENIYKRKDGRWEGRYLKRMPDGNTRYGYVYASTYRDARTRLVKAAALWEAAFPKNNGQETSFASVAQKWEETIGRQVKESTFVKYHTLIARHLLPSLGEMNVENLSFDTIDALALRLLNSGGKNQGPLSPRTVSDILAVLRSILRFARRSGMNILCDGSSVRIRRSAVDIRVLTYTEQDLLCRYINNNISPRNAGILLSLFTGLRVGEICALQWKDINLEDHLLYVRQTMQRIQNLEPIGPRTKLVVTPPKSVASVRTIPLTDEVVSFLMALPAPHEGYLLTGKETECVEPRNMQYHFHCVLKRSGVSDANYHALRHTFATRCVELGFDVKSLSELLGHSTVSMTLDRYVHPSLEHKREHMRRLSQLMEPRLFDGESDGELKNV